MEVLKNVLDLLKFQKDIRKQTKELAFVPTMGNLHDGHISLVREALKEHQVCIVSIFVNPLQFGPNEDFQEYPRTLEEDIEKLSKLMDEVPSAEIAIFAPSTVNVIFPRGYQTTIRNRVLDKILCGKSRPTHFEGVLTVVHRLFQLVRPTTAFFGLKDFQQFKLIQAMTRDFEMDIALVGCPIVRNAEGLALSSRNQYLSEQEKQHALKLSSSLKTILEMTEGKSWQDVCESVENFIQQTLQEGDFQWDYLEVRNKETLDEPEDFTEKFVVLGAMYFGKTRLIDNMFTPEKGNYVRSRPAPFL